MIVNEVIREVTVEANKARAEQAINTWILNRYQSSHADHLATCTEATAADTSGSDGTYGCETGCEYYRLTANIACPHVKTKTWMYGSFGELGNILPRIIAEAGVPTTKPYVE